MTSVTARSSRSQVAPSPAWQEAIVAPRARVVGRAIERAASVSPARADGPRAGWLAALAYGVAYTYGSRVDSKAIQLVAVVLEGANAFVFTDLSGDQVAIARLLSDDRLRSTSQRLVRERRDWIDGVGERLRAGSIGEYPVPEAVLAARAAVLLGGLCGRVDPGVLAQLDEVATWLGLVWESASAPVGEEAWYGAWAALGCRRERIDPRVGARGALAVLPPSALVEQIEDTLEMTAGAGRVFVAWQPRAVPPVAVREQRSASLASVEAVMEELVADGPPRFVAAAQYLRLQGGKRVRPQLVLLASEAVGGDPTQAIRGAAVVEWLHTASLVLDDMLDDAVLRRGAPTLHEVTDRPFAVAVFLWLLDRVAVGCRSLPGAVAERVRGAAERLADGQGSELAETGCSALSRTEYHRIVAAKTGALFACAAEVGARLGGADEGTITALRHYGREVGLAFQITDDVLDYVAEESVFGKRPGTDLLAGKATLPWLILREAASPEERARLDADLGRGADWTWIRSQVVDSGAAAAASSEARGHRDAAIAALSGVADGPARAALVQLAHDLVDRAR